MMTFKDMVQHMGKRKAIETAVHKRSTEKTNFDKTRGIKGRVKFRTCKHGAWIIDNYEPKECYKCILEYEGTKDVFHVQCDSGEYFNIGTGTYGTNKEHRRYARSQGMEEAG